MKNNTLSIVFRFLLLLINVLGRWFVDKKKHVLRLINFTRNRAVFVIMWKIMYSQRGHSALCMLGK